MHKDRILALADRIEVAPPEQFLMTTFFDGEEDDSTLTEATTPPCGTAACIGGWAFFTAPPERRQFDEDGWVEIAETARDWLGLTYDESSALFTPDNLGGKTKDEAVAVLRNFAETGRIEWP